MTRKPTFLRSEMLQFKDELRALPERSTESMSAKDVLVLLAPELRALRRRNYDWAALHELLKTRGIVVSDAVLKKRVAEAADRSGDERRKQRGAKRTASQEVIETSAPRRPRDRAPATPRPADQPATSTATPRRDRPAVQSPPAPAVHETPTTGTGDSTPPPRRSQFTVREDSEKL